MFGLDFNSFSDKIKCVICQINTAAIVAICDAQTLNDRSEYVTE